MTIRTKLALGYSLLVAAILILLGTIRYTGQKQMLEDQKDFSLRIVSDILDASLPDRLPSKSTVQQTVAGLVKNFPDIELKGTIIEVYDASRVVIYSSSLSEAERLPVIEKMWEKALRGEMSAVTIAFGNDTAPIRVLTKPVFYRDELSYLIQVGRSTQDIENTLENFLILNLFFIPVAALLVGIGGWLLTRRALKPLEGVIQTAHRISSGDLRHRIEADGASQEIRDLARAFNQMIVRLETSFLQIRDFSDNVSHELRIPLAILKGQTELGLRRIRSGDDYRKVLESNLEEILRMEKIVERLLFLSRAERGEIVLNLAPVDLADLVERVSIQFQAKAREKELRLVISRNGPVPFLGDEILLREVLMNLIANALQFTPQNGEIRLGLERENGLVRISVSDTGCGIPEKDLPFIFDRFYQVDESRANQGSGLGLCICQSIVRAHRGTIVVESRFHQGSRFTVTLPVKD